MNQPWTRCPDCGAFVPNINGPTHRYLGASPGCWALFGEVMTRELGDSRYGGDYYLMVDAYAVQHPGSPSPQSIQSVAIHLITLHAVFTGGVDPSSAVQVRQRASRHKRVFSWLEPPASLGAVTVADVHATTSPEEYHRCVKQWARSAWEAWAPHHATIHKWAALKRPWWWFWVRG